jgi:hypothetical protein
MCCTAGTGGFNLGILRALVDRTGVFVLDVRLKS